MSKNATGFNIGQGFGGKRVQGFLTGVVNTANAEAAMEAGNRLALLLDPV
jgi:hypothetical protein